MKQGAFRLSAIALGVASVALLMPVPPANAAVRHHGSAMHRSAMHAPHRAWGVGYRYAHGSGRHYHYGHGYRYAHGSRGYGWRGVAVAGGYYGGYYDPGYHHHSCWWYRHYDAYDMPSWCGTYSYAPAYDYSYGYDYGDYGPDVGFAYGYGPGYYGGGYGYARRYGFHTGHRYYGGQAGGFAGTHMGAFGGTHFVPRMGGANISGTRTAHIAGGFHGGIGGSHISGGLRIQH